MQEWWMHPVFCHRWLEHHYVKKTEASTSSLHEAHPWVVLESYLIRWCFSNVFRGKRFHKPFRPWAVEQSLSQPGEMGLKKHQQISCTQKNEHQPTNTHSPSILSSSEAFCCINANLRNNLTQFITRISSFPPKNAKCHYLRQALQNRMWSNVPRNTWRMKILLSIGSHLHGIKPELSDDSSSLINYLYGIR